MFLRRLEGSKGERDTVRPRNTSPYLCTSALSYGNHTTIAVGIKSSVSVLYCHKPGLY